MTSKPENPPAFPRTGEGFGSPMYDTPGMTLRDYFAGQCLVGVMTQAAGLGGLSKCDRATLFREMAGIIFETADAMLVARQS